MKRPAFYHRLRVVPASAELCANYDHYCGQRESSGMLGFSWCRLFKARLRWVAVEGLDRKFPARCPKCLKAGGGLA